MDAAHILNTLQNEVHPALDVLDDAVAAVAREQGRGVGKLGQLVINEHEARKMAYATVDKLSTELIGDWRYETARSIADGLQSGASTGMDVRRSLSTLLHGLYSSRV